MAEIGPFPTLGNSRAFSRFLSSISDQENGRFHLNMAFQHWDWVVVQATVQATVHRYLQPQRDWFLAVVVRNCILILNFVD